ncbi:MAG: dTDP-4-dehydrorhamnose reductase [Deltaproteobacteria bacterium RBG_13_43_22]|nr:MAG: dTDP-4-dehydrorhamnose reductase [Deltaproteobacteria bacterium RBG_13_43_22]
MKILVTGYPGLLSKDLVPILQADHQVVPLSIDDLDITRKAEVFKIIEASQAEVVINCAGYTAVDQAENDWEGAFRANALGVHYLALACHKFGVILCHISTDYVFDGRISRPYQPWDIPNPINVYGASKQAGEFFIGQLLNRYYIIRTSSLYGKHGNNFVQSIIKKAEQDEPLTIVCDQIMSPTWSVNLSRGILQVLGSENFGVYHLTDQTNGGISWFDFCKAILKIKGLNQEILPISYQNLDRPASRPAYSVLDTRYLTLATGYSPLHYQEALEQFLK